MKRILCALLFVLLLTSTASAYYIPTEYRAQIHNDVSVYKLSIQHMNEKWAEDALLQLAINYTNNGRLADLIIAMRKYGG